jgi:hypothetical protein
MIKKIYKLDEDLNRNKYLFALKKIGIDDDESNRLFFCF